MIPSFFGVPPPFLYFGYRYGRNYEIVVDFGNTYYLYSEVYPNLLHSIVRVKKGGSVDILIPCLKTRKS